MKLKKGMCLPINVSAMFNHRQLTYGKIIPDYLDDNVFYELYNHRGEKTCNDGERVVIAASTPVFVVIQSKNQKQVTLTKEEAELCFRMGIIQELRDEFGDVPMNSKTECLEEPWRKFPVGTGREEVWHWFEETFHISVAEDLMYQ